MERGGSGGDGERILDLAGPGKIGLELVDLRAHREHAALEDLGDLGELDLAGVGPA
jgi:hypothetical protein